MEFGVDTFDAPVSIGNGAFGDDMGISDMSRPQAQRVIDLFETRKRRRMRIGWIEENSTSGEYGGRRLEDRYNML